MIQKKPLNKKKKIEAKLCHSIIYQTRKKLINKERNLEKKKIKTP
jgi:hypothetical protein